MNDLSIECGSRRGTRLGNLLLERNRFLWVRVYARFHRLSEVLSSPSDDNFRQSQLEKGWTLDPTPFRGLFRLEPQRIP